VIITFVCEKNAIFSPKIGKNRRKLWSYHRPQEEATLFQNRTTLPFAHRKWKIDKIRYSLKDLAYHTMNG
jgi:hypothetical protein